MEVGRTFPYGRRKGKEWEQRGTKTPLYIKVEYCRLPAYVRPASQHEEAFVVGVTQEVLGHP